MRDETQWSASLRSYPRGGGLIASLGSVAAELDSVEHGALFGGPDYSVHSLAK